MVTSSQQSCIYGKHEDEILSLSEKEYLDLQKCPNCNETNEYYLERFPTTNSGKNIGNFMTMRCLSCGRFFSLSKNYEVKYN